MIVCETNIRYVITSATKISTGKTNKQTNKQNPETNKQTNKQPQIQASVSSLFLQQI